ncbi:MAG: polynucleotide adenylyltransferase PcnB [Planctomycetota bacterium]|nr:MAG: polynucleotide adenylyltransferase PcnB [Planctomycetota bacterium]
MASADEPRRTPLPFPRRRLDRRAVDVVRRLQDAGHETYLVGGCVRDLLVGMRPKDFDLATAARPEQVRRLFRRSRIIGRRFRLVHVYVGRNVYEVATFRRDPPGGRGGEPDEVRMIRRDNVFGTAREDALRRDFTVNALFLDPIREEILDWCGGLEDLRRGRLVSIGDPRRRFREDPVRILRLIKFLRRHGFEPGPAEVAAARELAPAVAQAAPPRVVEEVFRLMESGDMAGAWEDLEHLGLVPILLPDLAAWLDRGGDRRRRLLGRLGLLDDWIEEGGRPGYALRLCFLYGCLVEEELDPAARTLPVREFAQVPAVLFNRLQERARLPRHELTRAARILLAQLRLDPPAWLPRRRRRGTAEHLIEQDWFPDALEYLRCRLEADGRDPAPYDEWHERALSLEEGER